jgi:hypothetical protein
MTVKGGAEKANPYQSVESPLVRFACPRKLAVMAAPGSRETQ